MKKYEVMMMNTFVFETETSHTEWELSDHIHTTLMPAIREALAKRNKKVAEDNADSAYAPSVVRHQTVDSWASRVVYPSDAYNRVGLMSRLGFSWCRPSRFRDEWNNRIRYMDEDTVNTKFKRFRHLFGNEDDAGFPCVAFPKATYRISSEVFASMVEGFASEMDKQMMERFMTGVLEHYDGMYEDGVEADGGQ